MENNKLKKNKFTIEYEHFKNELLFCTKCKIYKKQDDFNNRKDAVSRKFKDYDCKDCVKLQRQNDYLKHRNSKLKSLNTLEGYIKTVLQHAKCRKKHEFNITFEDILNIYNKQKGLCVYTKEKLTYILGKGNINTNISLDRIDNTKGYVKDNIQLTLRIVNTMKSNSTENEFIRLCKIIAKNN